MIEFVETSVTAVIEKTLSVSGVEPFTVAVRSRTAARPEPTMTIVPDEVTLSYVFRLGVWELTGAEVSGRHAAGVSYQGRPALVRFVPGVHEDMPGWVELLAVSCRPFQEPGVLDEPSRLG